MRRMALAVFTFYLLGSLAACPKVSDWAREDLDISEASFRYLFEHNASYRPEQANAYYLEIAGADPPSEFLERFAGNTPPAKPASAFRFGSSRALLFGVKEIERIASEEVEVSAFHEEGFSQRLCCLSTRDYTLTVTRGEDGWVVQPPPVSPWEGADLDICEAVFRYQMQEVAHWNVSAYFLGIDGLDPSGEFLARFEDHTPPARPSSEFDLYGGGVLLSVTKVTWVNEEEVEARVSYYFNPWTASVHVLDLVRQSGRWVVAADEMDIVVR